jgi:hypothetical protein
MPREMTVFIQRLMLFLNQERIGELVLAKGGYVSESQTVSPDKSHLSKVKMEI